MATRRPTPPNRGTSRRPAANRNRTRSPQPRATSHTRQPTTRPVQYVPGRWGMPTPGRYPSIPGTPTGGGGVSAAPAAPAAAVPQYSLFNLPPDASYDQAVALLQRQRDEGLASIAGERARSLSDYGFHEGPTGTLTFDANNPFSKAAVMKKSYDTNRRSTAQSLGSGGQLYSGAFQNAQNLVNRNQLQSEDTLTKNLQAFLARNTGQRKEALTNYELAAGQAYGDRVGRFQTNPLYDPATADSTPAAPAAGPAAAPAGTPAARASAVSGMARRRRLTGARIGRI